MAATKTTSSSRASATAAPTVACASPPQPFESERYAGLFLRLSQQLEALEPVKPPPPASRRAPTVGDATDVALTLATRLLPPRDRIHEILRRNRCFSPAEEAHRRAQFATTTTAPTTEPSPSTAAITGMHTHSHSHAQPPPLTASSTLRSDTASAGGDAAGSAAEPAPPPPPAPEVMVPVGGRARVLATPDLARVKLGLRRRSHALTNLAHAHARDQALRLGGVQSGASAVSSSWEAQLLSSAGQHQTAVAGKQALIADLMGRTRFTTQHIFQMSRRFKALAGPAKSVISFAEFQHVLGADVGALLHAIGVSGARDGFAELESTDLSAIGATISASDSFLRRLFHTFDADGDGHIDFREFVVGLYGFVKGSLEDKVAALFAVLRRDNRHESEGGDDGGDGDANGDADHSHREDTVAISDLLGLIQGDRALYQELMGCVDEYFVRVELREENTISADEFVAASTAEPALLDTLARPSPSAAFGADAALRERVHAFVNQRQLAWSTLLAMLQRAVAAASAPSTASLSPSSARSSVIDCKDTGGRLAGSTRSLDVGDPLPLLPLGLAHQILLEIICASASSEDADAITQLVRAYVKPPPAVPVPTSTSTPVSGFGSCAAPVSVSFAELLQDLAAVLHANKLAAADTESRARYYFDLYDLNRDGFLSRSELVAGVCAGFAHFGAGVTSVVRVLEDEDEDQDGELTMAQYLRAARRSPLILASLYTCLHTGGSGGGNSEDDDIVNMEEGGDVPSHDVGVQ